MYSLPGRSTGYSPQRFDLPEIEALVLPPLRSRLEGLRTKVIA